MLIHPIVRYMLLCEDWSQSGRQKYDIAGLLSSIHALDDVPFPLVIRELCVFLVLTDGYGSGPAQIFCVSDDTGERVFGSQEHLLRFPSDPSEVMAVAFRILDCEFRIAGNYLIQFYFDGELVEERTLRLR